jgi:hypothetical protein
MSYCIFSIVIVPRIARERARASRETGPNLASSTTYESLSTFYDLSKLSKGQGALTLNKTYRNDPMLYPLMKYVAVDVLIKIVIR